MSNLRQQFIAFSVSTGVLRFGDFTTKAGRQSPYFFNAGLFHEGATLAQLAQFYAQTLLDSGVQFDMLFGPAYKGITLASATAVALAGKVVIVDDVISAGTSVRESVDMIRAAGAEPCAVLIALDRMERSGKDGELSASSAVQEVSREFGIPVISIGNLDDLFSYLNGAGADPELQQYKAAVAAYRTRYGI